MKQSKTMELKKPVRVSLARQVLTAMESMIRSGKWKVGDRIPAEAELARAFSVSHNTIREALQSLIHMGMLEARPGDGTYVMASDRFAVAVSNRLKESELPQILEARLALEKEIARLAAVKRTDEDLKELENALEACRKMDGNKYIDIKMRQENNRLVICFRNSFNGFIQKDIRFNADAKEHHYTEYVRFITLDKFKEYAKAADLKIKHTLGDYNLNLFDETKSSRLILILE